MSDDSTVLVRVGHHLPKGEDLRLSALLGAALRKRHPLRPRRPKNQEGPAFWSAEVFELSKSRAWRELNRRARERVLTACNQQVLREAWLIEKAGMSYAAKMVLLSESLDEQQLYCAIASEEAAHFAALQPWVEAMNAVEGEVDAFHGLLAKIIANGRRRPLILMIQVLLEGWGLQHYRALADQCQDEALRDVFEEILEDEGRHHGSGLVLLRDSGSAWDSDLEDEGLSGLTGEFESAFLEFSAMVRLGPQAVASAIRAERERETGPMGLDERVALFDDLDCEQHSQHRLDILRELLARAISPERLAALDQAEAFRPRKAAECAGQ
jgi:rubrerythrin